MDSPAMCRLHNGESRSRPATAAGASRMLALPLREEMLLYRLLARRSKRVCRVQRDRASTEVDPMKISSELRDLLKRERGVFVAEACDQCSRLLDAVRFTRLGQPGAWCSRECRDGANAHAPGTCRTCGASLAGLRRGAKFCSDVCRMRLLRKNEKSQTRQIIPNEPLEPRDLKAGLEVLAVSTQPGPFAIPGTPAEKI